LLSVFKLSSATKGVLLADNGGSECEVIGDCDISGIVGALIAVVEKAPKSVQSELLRNIVLTGGLAGIPSPLRIAIP